MAALFGRADQVEIMKILDERYIFDSFSLGIKKMMALCVGIHLELFPLGIITLPRGIIPDGFLHREP